MRSVVSLVVVALGVFAIVASTGRAAALTEGIRRGLESPSARLVRVSDTGGRARLQPEDAQRVGGLRSVAWWIALDPPQAVARNAYAGDATVGYTRPSVGIRRYAGQATFPGLASLAAGRLPGPGQAVAGARAARELGLADGVGAVSSGGTVVPVVGTVSFSGALGELDGYVLVNSLNPGTAPPTDLGTVIALARRSGDVAALARSLPDVLAPADPTALGVDEPGDRNALLAGLAAAPGDLDAAILAGALCVGAALVSLNGFGAVAARRREIGLRRVQGAERTTIVALLLLETGALGAIGALAGLTVGMAAVWVMDRTAVDPSLGLAIAVLMLVSGLAGSLPPAIAAGRQEPVYALRG